MFQEQSDLFFDSFRHLVIRLDWRSTPHVRYSALAELSLTASYPLFFQSAIPTCPSEKLYLLDLSVESLAILHDFGLFKPTPVRSRSANITAPQYLSLALLRCRYGWQVQFPYRKGNGDVLED